MLDKGVRVEQQALAANSLEFVANEYLPEKIENETFLNKNQVGLNLFS
ncbi:hypothetical protein HRED_10669 [Candidatus Haloredivivus sp. G17]|nr:hypothetical protein HRED_10669 [Candidatus Haloredivivus sp. G17]